MKLGSLKKNELEDMARGLFGEKHRNFISVVTSDMDIYTCYSRVAKCNLPTFKRSFYSRDYYDRQEEMMGQMWHNKHNEAGYKIFEKS